MRYCGAIIVAERP